MSRPGRIALWSLAALSAAVLVLGLWVFSAFNGGLDDVLDFSRPSETDEAVQQARTQAASRAAAQTEATAALAVSAFGGQAAPAKRGQIDECAVGEDSYLRDDPFDLQCADAASTTVSGAAVTPATMAALDAALTEAGWGESLSLVRIGKEYWVTGAETVPAAVYFRGDQRLDIGFEGPRAVQQTVQIEIEVTTDFE